MERRPVYTSSSVLLQLLSYASAAVAAAVSQVTIQDEYTLNNNFNKLQNFVQCLDWGYRWEPAFLKMKVVIEFYFCNIRMVYACTVTYISSYSHTYT